MEASNNQLTQPEPLSPMNNQPVGAEKSFSLTRRQIILIGLLGGLVLLLIFSLGIRAGEKRLISPGPTIVPSPTPTPTSTSTSTPASFPTKVNGQGTVDQSCFEGYDCVIGIEQGSQTIYSRGICKNGVCIPRPTSAPKSEERRDEVK